MGTCKYMVIVNILSTFPIPYYISTIFICVSTLMQIYQIYHVNTEVSSLKCYDLAMGKFYRFPHKDKQLHVW